MKAEDTEGAQYRKTATRLFLGLTQAIVNVFYLEIKFRTMFSSYAITTEIPKGKTHLSVVLNEHH